MNDFRCTKCRQLQYKYKVTGNKLIIEVKCYNCNNFSYLTINLNTLIHQNDTDKKQVD